MTADMLQTKKEVKVFLLINFGIIIILGLLLFLSRSTTNYPNTPSNFALTFMLIPAFAAIIVLKYICKIEFTKNINDFFKIFIFSTLLQISFLIIGTFFIEDLDSIVISITQSITSLVLIIKVFEYKNDFESLNLKFTKNIKTLYFDLGIFIIIFFLPLVIELILNKPIAFSPTAIWKALLSSILNFFFGFIIFFGEEFGWRYFLQPRLQKLYGKRLGVIILGAIWGIWHLPLCFTLYSPKTPILCVIGHIISCIGLAIFMGYAYMNTCNMWVPILIHLLNNCLIIMFNNGSIESVLTSKDIISLIIFSIIVYTPFLFTKVYKKDLPES
ncbi:hypothetical protein SAMN02745196_02643 [Clostridium collagenovorans DSM 3089]|uniref:CAAX prenyl protease 2/Lysostaphin resistance protein A-like domain-containing protein n=1 Tax=Clostridium collagenovorans DSM 3089 TaxID=1121306 RepID=A0A1M5Y430_9CLOT|nr:CPBP family intramembrane glutamic endopeptidase [Clostridium collagenovorans]SHI06797.1 hypothetical protein SAMN02745196_02643 [Clostridium collagenovorans DSM 3089]